ncbi:pentachlorophenol monooxygenase [Allosaccharopolyspora coralli]|uniref:Pentachlorophenol monooxygenase n=1 Tax=Allosaccharopolyspora coralli TaxID=2665642 RepID=A0A5Q3Q7M9_9PSEU|nr:FAD-dependent monooxygenase [Allosaccharopolyspora coralli]QGK69184.1 pentachlorophenol monooxygenase [Allosaccharopolyspora coralli]
MSETASNVLPTPGTWPGEPVLVLGAGPVGQTTALLLARWGVPAILVDQRPRRDAHGSKAICQQRDVLDVWEAVGAGGRIAAEGLTWSTARTFYRDTELFSVDLATSGHPAFPPFVNLSQSRTEQILDDCLAAEPLIDVRWGAQAIGVEQDTTGVEVHCTDGTVLRSSYLVVCTGGHSALLRRMLGVRFDGHSFDDRFLICDIRADLPGWDTERRFYFDPAWNPGRQVLIHPCPDSTYRIDWQVPGDYDLEAEEASGALDDRIRAIIGDRQYEIVWQSVYRFHSRVASRMRCDRILLAGDAAHLYSPFGARGLNSGVGDAENAAWKIAYVGRGWAPEGLLETYHDERHAAARENLAVTTATMNFLVPPDEERAQRRTEILESATTEPGARADVDSGRLSEPFWYCVSPLTTPDPRRPAVDRPPRGQVPPAGPGVLLPDVPVRTPDGPSRLRALARDGFLLLAGAEVETAAARRTVAHVDTPVRVLALDEIDPDGTVRDALATAPTELWVVRPDAHVAAVLTDPTPETITAALTRATAATAAEPAIQR